MIRKESRWLSARSIIVKGRGIRKPQRWREAGLRQNFRKKILVVGESIFYYP